MIAQYNWDRSAVSRASMKTLLQRLSAMSWAGYIDGSEQQCRVLCWTFIIGMTDCRTLATFRNLRH